MAILQMLNDDILFLISFLCNDYTFKKEFKTLGLKMAAILGIIGSTLKTVAV